jgi:hypothetical protein
MAEYTDLRNASTFPTFAICPSENDIDLDFYTEPENGFFRPSRHWCLLAEIIDIEHFFRLRLIVKDKLGRLFPVAFYTEGAGSELEPSMLKKGYTIAILYPHKHGFMDFSMGIRQEDISTVKVCLLLYLKI